MFPFRAWAYVCINVCMFMRVYVLMRVCVSECVCMDMLKAQTCICDDLTSSIPKRERVCVCVCERERERERK